MGKTYDKKLNVIGYLVL